MLGPEQKDTEHFLVAPENWTTVEVFLALRTQWRWLAGMGGAFRAGLDYAAVESFLRLLKVKDRSRVFNGVMIMEKAAMEYWNEQ